MAPCRCLPPHLVLSPLAPDWAPWVAPGPVHPLLALGRLTAPVAVLRLCGSEAVPSPGLPSVAFPQGAAGALAVTNLNHLMWCLCAFSFQETKGKNPPPLFLHVLGDELLKLVRTSPRLCRWW